MDKISNLLRIQKNEKENEAHMAKLLGKVNFTK